MVQNGELAALKVGREYRVTLVALAELSILQQIPTFPMCTIKVRQEDVCESAYIERDTLEYWAFQCSAKRSNCFTHRVHRLNPALPTTKKPETVRLNSDKVLFSFARGRERCDRNGHAVFLRPGVDSATTGSEITGISTSSTKLK